MVEFEDAKDKVMMGAERRSMVMTDEEKRLTAYHEGGHAVVAAHLEASDPIHKATIIPRGRALGMVVAPAGGADRISVSREKLEADITVAMGGRIAEEMIFGYEKVTSGASSDIKMATQIARGNGHPVRHVRRARPAQLQRERAGSLPRPLDHAAEERLRADGAQDRPRGPQDHRRSLWQGKGHPLRQPGAAAPAGQRAARVRIAQRRGDRCRPQGRIDRAGRTTTSRS